MKKGILFFMVPVVALALAACPDSSSSGGGGGNGNNAVFSVALASDVKAGVTEILAPGTANTDATKAVGLAVKASEAMQGVPADTTTADPVELEVWFTDTKYVYDGETGADVAKNGTPKPKTTGGTDNYVIKWVAYDPAVDTPTKYANSYTATTVSINGATTAKPARMKIQVGATEIVKPKGVVVAVLVYENGKGATPGLADKVGGTEGLVARYELTLTKAAAIDLTGLGVSAKGAAAANAGAATAAATVAAVVSTTAGFTVGDPKNTATVTLELATSVHAATGSVATEFNTFKVTGTAGWLVGKWAIVPGTVGGNIVATTVSDAVLADSVTATFTAAAANAQLGGVILTGTDKYGQTGTITVTLDPKYS